MWREAPGCSFTHLGVKSSEKGSVQVGSSVQRCISACSQEEQKGADSWLEHSRRGRRFGLWSSVLIFVTGFVHAIWWCSQVWWLELCWPKQWWSRAQMLVLAARWDHFHYNSNWSDACNEIKQNIYRQTMLQRPGHMFTPCLVHSPRAEEEFPCPDSTHWLLPRCFLEKTQELSFAWNSCSEFVEKSEMWRIKKH